MFAPSARCVRRVRLLFLPVVLLPGVLLAAASPAAAAEENLPVQRIVLFHSGVGFFERSGEVEGNAEVELKFSAGDVNDLLKSLVVEDRGGGRVSTVTYGSRDPITKTLATFAIDLTSNPTLADLLAQVRGEPVEVEAPEQVEGTIVGISTRKERVGEEVIEQQYLTLLTNDGLRTFPLDSLGRIRLLNERINNELQQALKVLAMGHETDKKSVTVRFSGQGKRPVRVGYIQQTPIWKTSYRLVLRDKDAPLLQGWAIVENTSDNDWNDVRLTLVSGRPISFMMDLYEPLYMPRPLVEPELFASLRPPVYEQDLRETNALARGERLNERTAGGVAGVEELAARRTLDKSQLGLVDENGRQLGRDLVEQQLDQYGLALDAERNYRSVEFAFENASYLGRSAAQASELGELFQYEIEMPVTLPRQQSAMLPIVNESVQAVRVSIYNEAVHAKHPLNGLRLTNSTPMHLMQGPITVFDGGSYAGDARIEDLPPGTERLISYAMDLDTEVAFEDKGRPQELVSLKIVRGGAHTSHKYEATRKYTVKNSGQEARSVVIEFPREEGWELVSPREADETTRDAYRFAVNAQPGKPAELVVERQRIIKQEVAITNWDHGTIQVFLRSDAVSPEVKEALSEVIRRQQSLAALDNEAKQRETVIREIDSEQSRIRENMRQLDRNSDLYQRYVKKFNDQEDQMETLRTELAALRARLSDERTDLDRYLQNLSVE